LTQSQIAALQETRQTTLHSPALDQNVAAAAAAAQSYVGAESIDQPLAPTTGMGSPESNDVAEPKLDDFGLTCTHAEQPIRRGAIKTSISAAQSIRAGASRRTDPASSPRPAIA
jgi:hypothetical protein